MKGGVSSISYRLIARLSTYISWDRLDKFTMLICLHLLDILDILRFD
jgi:hypothetical protein